VSSLGLVTFKGWPAEAIEFYDGLEVDNSRSYWLANKNVYDSAVKGPMDELLAELAPEFGPAKVFRPNRDVRFSADKSPYKTAIAASLSQGGYLQFSAGGLGAGTGMYVMAPDQLERYRQAVDDDTAGGALAGIVGTLGRAGIEVTAHESLKTAPRGYPKDHPRVDLLRQKGLVSWKQWPVGAWLGTAQAKKRVVEFLRASRPVTEWLAVSVGPSTDERYQ
jgi:uncharacterized protein (TIGR02453 family)